MCIDCGDEHPFCAMPGENRIWCYGCAKDHPGAVNVVHKKCIVCKFYVASNVDPTTSKKTKLYCTGCLRYSFPDSISAVRYCTKEKFLMSKLQELFPGYTFVLDKRVEGGCSKRRPDCLIDTFTKTIIIECDEGQHKTYDTTCELARINELYTDLGDRPMIMIRFNPDGYVDELDKKHPTCINISRDGKAGPGANFVKRFQVLVDTLKKVLDEEVPNDQLTIINLWFDGSDENGLSMS
jgi:hypothetical protein